jgi:hypothetical protein
MFNPIMQTQMPNLPLIPPLPIQQPMQLGSYPPVWNMPQPLPD